VKSIFRTLVAIFAAMSIMSTASTAFAESEAPDESGAPSESQAPVESEDSPESEGTSGWLTQGGEILPKGAYALELRVGWPAFDVGVHIPITSKFEIMPFFTLDYGFYNVRAAATIGNTLGVQLKGQLWQNGPDAVTLGADLGIAMDYIGGFDAAFQIGGPEVKYSHRWDDPRIALIAGLRVPIRVWMRAAAGEIPILVNAGVEYNVIKELNIHANFEFGPSVYVARGGIVRTFAHAGGRIGISYLW
jgi:hypothetical protein